MFALLYTKVARQFSFVSKQRFLPLNLNIEETDLFGFFWCSTQELFLITVWARVA